MTNKELIKTSYNIYNNYRYKKNRNNLEWYPLTEVQKLEKEIEELKNTDFIDVSEHPKYKKLEKENQELKERSDRWEKLAEDSCKENYKLKDKIKALDLENRGLYSVHITETKEFQNKIKQLEKEHKDFVEWIQKIKKSQEFFKK